MAVAGRHGVVEVSPARAARPARPAVGGPGRRVEEAAAEREGVLSRVARHRRLDGEEELVGDDIYLDTSMGTEYYGRERFLNILKGHGADRILFATDSPWSDAGKEIENLRSWGISEGDLDKIFFKNACALLGIPERGRI